MSNRLGIFPGSWWKGIRQDIRVFVYLFPWRTAFFLLLVLLLTSLLFYLAYIRFEDPDFPPQRAFFAVINLTFFQVNYSELPRDPRLDFFTVFVPLVELP